MVFLFVILGIILIILIVMIFKKVKKSPPPPPQMDLSSLSITDARLSDSISVAGQGDDYDDLDFVVDRKNRYESGDEKWYELSGKYKGRRVYVEYDEGDELEVTVNLARTSLTLSDLGLNEDDLTRMDEEQSTSNGLEYNGERWQYMLSQKIGYFQDDRGEGEGYYSWSFQNQDGRRVLFIDKWEGKPFEGGLAEVVDQNDVTVYRS